jgi:cytochrome b561
LRETTSKAMKTNSRYSSTAKWLHWVLAIGIVYTFGLGWVMTAMTGISPTKLKYFSWHKWAGVTLFVLAVVRLVWRYVQVPGPLPASITGMHRTASSAMHGLLLAATILVPLSGYLYSLAVGYPIVYFGLFELPVVMGRSPTLAEPLRLIHQWSSYAMALAVMLHAAAALMHQFHYRDNVLTDMLPQRKSVPSKPDPTPQ